MITEFSIDQQIWQAELRNGIDISLAVSPNGPLAWYVDPPRITPVMTDRFVGSIAKGGKVNFFDVAFNPHGNGTHTECLGHITKTKESVNQLFNQWMLPARLITIEPVTLTSDRSEWVRAGDRVITPEQLALVMGADPVEALLVRTLPNSEKRRQKNYSNTNAPYFLPEAMDWLNRFGIRHLLVDLPSVDREEDGGALVAHHHFWNVPHDPQTDKTITELIYVPDEVEDGIYLLNLQVAALENDASPSRPVLFKAQKK
jgi:arylformamidase